jgi:hypothetical protein
MTPRSLVQTLAASSLFAFGCAGTFQHYQPLTVQVEAERDARTAAVQELASHEGWHVIAQHARGGRIEAFADETPTRRDHIYIDATRGNVRIAIQTELRDGSGEWLSSDTVCPSYSYARENQVAEQIERIVHRRQATE